jgi:mannose-6-phosphate isomerase-like protein (cupin superfamily)
MYVFKEPSEFAFVKVGIKGKKFLINQLVKNAGVVLIETEKGHKTTIIEHESDFIYYVLEGKGYFKIDDIKENFSKGNLIVIPHGAKFTYKGRAKFLLITSPPFKPEQEETVINE